jgi:hypothetical protein
MFTLALSTPTGEPLSWVAAMVVLLGLIGLGVGAALQRRRHRASSASRSSTDAAPRA